VFELTNGDVKIEQLFCAADARWGTEWEHAVLGRNGRTLETKNAFAYKFDDGRIAEMWMVCAAPAGSESFWD
jgi:ketosteroid isomerase-like protein